MKISFTQATLTFFLSSLSGLSPLLGEDDNETLANVTAAEWDFEDESFDVISDEAKDFIGQLLMKNSRYVQEHTSIAILDNKTTLLALKP